MRYTRFLVLLTSLLQPVLVSASIGPFTITDPDSNAEIRFQFAGQLRMQLESRDMGADTDRDDATSMEARRIRPTLGVKLPGYHLDFKLQLSLAPGAAELMDFYFDYEAGPGVQLRAGQFKIPFTRYRIQSFQRLTFADWSITTRYFGAERQMGFAVHNGYENPPELSYAVGIFSGVNARASHGVALPIIYGEEMPNPSDLAGRGERISFHPELVGHFSYNPGGISVQSDTDTKRTGYRHSVSLSAAWDLNPDSLRDMSLRVAMEYLVKYRGFSASAAGYLAWIETLHSADISHGLSGGLIQAAWRMSDRFEVSGRYAIVNIEDELYDAAYSRAQALLNDPGSLTPEQRTRYAKAGLVSSQQEATLGLNVYFDGHSLKWQNDAGLVHSCRRDSDRTDYTMRSQFQIAF